jgi:hypothetical protein
MKQGIYNIPEIEYRNDSAVSKHGLDSLAISPLHFWAYYLNPERPIRKDTPASVLGKAIHTSVLEPQRFEEEYIQEPDSKDFKGVLVSADDYKNECRKRGLKLTGTKEQLKTAILASGGDSSLFWENRYETLTKGKTVLPTQSWRVTQAITGRVRKHPAASDILKYGQAEQSIFWMDEETGVGCKGRIDWLTDVSESTDAGILFDLKSTLDASPEGFQRSISKYRYYVQAAMYIDGLRALGYMPKAFIFAAWEKKSPYASALYYATPEMLEAGRQEYRRLLKIYADCLSSDKWPGYSQEILPISMPSNFQGIVNNLENEDDWLTQMESI